MSSYMKTSWFWMMLYGNRDSEDGYGGDGGGEDEEIWYGGAGDDTITGHSGNDRIFGLDGNDRLQGSDGNDRLQGGNGIDDIRGGAGRDGFSYAEYCAGEVKDFNSLEDDYFFYP